MAYCKRFKSGYKYKMFVKWIYTSIDKVQVPSIKSMLKIHSTCLINYGLRGRMFRPQWNGNTSDTAVKLILGAHLFSKWTLEEI